jgi:peptidoglycan/xylan/chitin deacetylase (PgdA/CDA1 family)
MPTTEKKIFLTFDDGPHPTATPFVLDELKKYNAHASFFCIGKNVEQYFDLYKRIIDEGHAVGNHTQHHLNGWKNDDKKYLDDIFEAKKHVDSNLFRPPYGRIKKFQLSQLLLPKYQMKTIMWSVLSGDFDQTISKEQCCKNVIQKSTSGDIIVFHDSEKAFENMRFTLPKVLQHFSEKGYQFDKIII